MKKLVSVMLVLILQLSIALGYTATMKVKDVDLVVTSEAGNVVEIQEKDPGIKGWKINKGDISIVDNKFTMPNSDVEIEAILEYTVSFNANGGTGSMPDQTFSYNVAKNLNANTFTRTGYKFLGWAESSSGKVEYEDGASYIADDFKTLYAVWEKYKPKLASGNTWYSQGSSSISTTKITSITLANTYTPGTVVSSWDASEGKVGTVTAYIEDDGSGNSTYKLTLVGDGSGKIIANEDSSYAFSNSISTKRFKAITTLNNLNILDTSYVTNMDSMFYYCQVLTSLDVSSFDTSNVTNMYGMFYDCQALTSLDVSNFDTSNVTDMQLMFKNCQALTSLDVSNFDTSNVTDMTQMFYSCQVLTNIDVSNFDTSKVTRMKGIFMDCHVLTSVDVSNFDTSNVTSMEAMFSGCRLLTSLDVSNFDTSNVTSMQSMFSGCRLLTSLDVSNFDTGSLTNMQYMFDSCEKLKTLDVSNFDTSNVTNMKGVFNSCKALTNIDVSGFDISNVTYMEGMFRECYALTSLELNNFDTSNVTDMDYMFYNCQNLKTLDLSSFDTSSTKYMTNMFYNMYRLEEIKLGANFSFMGSKTSSLCTLPTPSSSYIPGADGNWYNSSDVGYAPANVPNNVADTYTSIKPGPVLATEEGVWYTQGGTTIPKTSIRIINLVTSYTPTGTVVEQWDATKDQTGKITAYVENDINGKYKLTIAGDGALEIKTDESCWKAFGEFENVEEINGLEILNTENTTEMSVMFYNCYSLKELDLGTFNTSNVIDMRTMFYECESLESINLSSFDTSNVTAMLSMFYGCRSLRELDLSNFDTSKVTGSNMYQMFQYVCVEEITLGEKFAFVGTASELPEPNERLYPEADGMWYNSKGQGYWPEDIPNNVADTYYATNNFIEPGPNAPVLATGLVPVNWDGTEWKMTTEANWEYDYEIIRGESNTVEGNGKGKWANAMTLDGSMYVWIPRYTYKVVGGYKKDTNSWNSIDNPGGGRIDVRFSNGVVDDTRGNYIKHPAFSFGEDELAGIWVAKYEASRNDATESSEGTGTTVTVRPGVKPWGRITASQMYDYAYNMNRDLDSHMMRNSEWGAVAYLTNAVGRTPYINSSGITGTGGGTQDTGGTDAWNTVGGVKASTTHNVYGIYDMSGGSREYVATYMGRDDYATLGSIHANKDTKYVETYPIGDDDLGYTSEVKGDAVYETSYEAYEFTNYGEPGASWDNDFSTTVSEYGPIFERGGSYSDGEKAGIYAFTVDFYGYSDVDMGFRPVLAVLPKTVGTITFNANGGEGNMPAQSLYKGIEQTIRKNTFTKANSAFQGWATSASGSVVYEDEEVYTQTGNRTLYAKWGLYGDANDDGKIDIGDAQNVYSYINGSITEDDINLINADVNIDGVIDDYDYQLIFAYNVGEITQFPYRDKIVILSGFGTKRQFFTTGETKVLMLNWDAPDGYAFHGWSTTEDGEVEYEDGANYTANDNATLYAVWGLYGDANDDGAVDGADISSITDYILGRTTDINLINADVNEDGIIDVYDKHILNNYLVGNISPLPYMGKLVVFEGNGGTNADGDFNEIQTFTTGETKALTTSTFTKANHVFMGWSTTSTGAVAYADGANYTANDNITLYAVWKQICSVCKGDGTSSNNCTTCSGAGFTGYAVCTTCTGSGNCTRCRGVGLYGGTCSNCDGVGWFEGRHGEVECEACSATGYGNTCTTCGGNGNCATCYGSKITTNWCTTCGRDGKIDSTCTTCGGTGGVDSSNSCVICNGTTMMLSNCATCSGAGFLGNSLCSTCTGSGNCSRCGGSGLYGGTCDRCEGSGWVEGRHGEVECTRCNGSGNANTCTKCGGDGNCDACNTTGISPNWCSECLGDGEVEVACPKCSGNDVCLTCAGIGTLSSNCATCSGAGFTGSAVCTACSGDGDTCATCRGYGLFGGTCSTCEGAGYIEVEGSSHDYTCRNCGGSGAANTCSSCGGSGSCATCSGTGTMTKWCTTCNKDGKIDVDCVGC